MARSIGLWTVVMGVASVTGFFRLAAAKGPPQASSALRFSEHLIAGNYGYNFGLSAADLDDDGDLDLTSPDLRGKRESMLYWFEYQGRGEFLRRVLHENEPGWFELHAIGDWTPTDKPSIQR